MPRAIVPRTFEPPRAPITRVLAPRVVKVGTIGEVFTIDRPVALAKVDQVNGKIEALNVSFVLWAKGLDGGKGETLDLPTGPLYVAKIAEPNSAELYASFQTWRAEWKSYAAAAHARPFLSTAIGTEWSQIYHDAEKYELHADDYAKKLNDAGGHASIPKTVTDKELESTKPSLIESLGLSKLPWGTIALLAGGGVATYYVLTR